MFVMAGWANAEVLGKIIVAENFVFVFDVFAATTRFRDLEGV
jgi:hypothetical protein